MKRRESAARTRRSSSPRLFRPCLRLAAALGLLSITGTARADCIEGSSCCFNPGNPVIVGTVREADAGAVIDGSLVSVERVGGQQAVTNVGDTVVVPTRHAAGTRILASELVGLECRRPGVSRCERYFTVVRVLDGSPLACAFHAKTSTPLVFTEAQGIELAFRPDCPVIVKSLAGYEPDEELCDNPSQGCAAAPAADAGAIRNPTAAAAIGIGAVRCRSCAALISLRDGETGLEVVGLSKGIDLRAREDLGAVIQAKLDRDR